MGSGRLETRSNFGHGREGIDDVTERASEVSAEARTIARIEVLLKYVNVGLAI